MECLNSVPVDKCCLVVQMPTVEEMKREVADITCEMQSVYIDNSLDSSTLSTVNKPSTNITTTTTNIVTSSSNDKHHVKYQSDNNVTETNLIHSNMNNKTTTNSETINDNSKLDSIYAPHNNRYVLNKSLDSRWSTLNIGGDYHNDDDNDEVDGTSNLDTFKLNRFGSMLVDRKRLNEHSLSKFISPSVNSSSSSCPREEQVSEEFIINGKRYRQIYQRRVVLERKTTRDVFFLPGNNTDAEIRPSNKNQFEYRSPHYDEQVSSTVADEESTINSTDSPNDYVINRPGLHLTVLHTKKDSETDEPCLSPAIVLRSLNETRNNYKYSNNSSCLQCSTSPKSNNSLNPNILNQKKDNSEYTDINVSEVIHSSSRARQIVRSLSNSIKRSISTGIQNTRNFIKFIPEKSKEMESINRFNKLRASLDNDLCMNTSKQDNSIENNHEVIEMKSKQIMGYMYKFGVWDDKQPVLDPRLPIFLNSSIENTSNVSGTVIPTAPEWHHAEVGLENTEKFQGAYVRGRTVACLQRFTQHSLASGKALHRSTYVQQTRLVRQLNRSGERKKGDTESGIDEDVKSKEREHEERSFDSSPKHLLSDPCVFDRGHLSKYELRPDDTTQPTNHNASGKFIQCSNDRLQLLQSLCPSAAAATILLGKPIHDTHDNDDINQNTMNKSNELNETRVLVTANSWCPVSLRTKDPESQLIFNSNYRDNNNSNTSTQPNTPKHSPSSVTVPEPTIRGGTLDGLLIYTLNLLQTPMPTSHPDYLFPDVIRLTYPTFTTPDKITERLIQMYVAYAPIEPGCQNNDWIDALAAADYLVTIARDIHPEQLTASLILRLNRFARLLMYDNQLILNEQIQDDNQISGEPHRVLADRLLEKLPILSSKQKLTSYSNKVNSSINNNVECVWTTRNPGEHKAESNNSLSEEPLANNDSLTEQNNTRLARMKNHKSASLLTADIRLSNSEPHEDAIQRASEFLEYDARLIAEEITQIEEEKFAKIDFYELLNIEQLEKGEAQTLGKCVDHFNQITRWAKGMLFILAPKIVEKYSTLNLLNHQIKSTTNKSSSLFNNFRSCHTSYSSDTSDIQYENKLKHIECNTHSDVEMINNVNVTNDNLMKSYSFNKHFTHLSSQHKDISMRKIVSINVMLLKLCEILKHLKQLHNFSSFLALLLAIQELPECLLSKKSKQLVTNFSSYMKPPNFSEYRRDLETSPLPCLPYLGLIFQQLIHLHIGNPIHLMNSPTTTLCKNDKLKHEIEFINEQNNSVNQSFKPLKMISTSSPSNLNNVINVWRCWKHYMVLGYFIKRKEGSIENIHHFPHNPQINRVINNFQDQFNDKTLDKAKQQLIILQRSKRNILTR
ncbi:hypothetical protein MN116_006721 [Schistosoma mekongi]|uniref:Ras-GEF domain-containing protein n=1 Tax=Schistosoma mekongi TaxID=38744 RepID=A0AAE1Z8M3_SCHME|nr:hypothetical protein MN116_006721 [Schistosoma mekongi]